MDGDAGGDGVNCVRCKKEIPEESRFCNHCGAPQEAKRTAKARGNGQGSVYKRGKRWVATVTLGYYIDPATNTTKRKTRSRTFDTKRDATQALSQLRYEAPRPKVVTFRQAYAAWFPTHRAGKSTMGNYQAAFQWFSGVWFIPLPDIDIDDLQECIDECPRGRRTKENMKALAGLIYDFGIPRKMVPEKINLGHYLTVSGEYGSKDGLPLAYLETLKQNIRTVPGADFIVAQCYLGFRPSELLALKVADYNAAEAAFVGGSKTDAGRDRVVTVSPKIAPIIDRLMAGKPAEAYVFSTADGAQMPLKAYRQLFYDALDACGLSNEITTVSGVSRHRYTPHSCRHTFATLMKAVPGADKDKLELIGHTSTEMLRHYQDVSFADLRAITDAL